MSQNVFSYGYKKSYYIKHPIKWWRETISNFKAAWRRATKGWCHMDCWEFGYWFLDIVPDMLDYLADNAAGWPVDDKYPTYEDWQNHLRSIANLLRNAREESRDQKNEYYEEYEKYLKTQHQKNFEKDEHGNVIYKPDNAEIIRLYFKRDGELEAEQDIMIEEALKLLAETPLKALWD